jgi:oligopeptide/dipeptide ABC transporter ATP-binding protein
MGLLEVQRLQAYFYTPEGVVPAVDDVSFSVGRGETVGMVGESGCGKSVTSLCIMRLLPHPGRIIAGSLTLEGEDLLSKSEKEMQRIRGSRVSMVFQEPMTSLNPVMTVGNQIMEVLRLHTRIDRKNGLKQCEELLDMVGISAPRQRLGEYPHQLSGGMRQRVMIAMALACKPRLLIADEPTTALDVTIQAQILELMKRLKEELGMALLLITHDLGIVAEMAERVAVMYAGKVVESAPVGPVFREPAHPYTQGLLASLPKIGARQDRLPSIPGGVPNPLEFPPGCRFHPRCVKVMERCRADEPPVTTMGEDRDVRCWLYA